MQQHARRPGVGGVAPPVVPPAAPSLNLGVFYAEPNSDDASPTTAARKQIVKDTAHYQITTLSNQGMVLGSTEESTTSFASYNWAALDARIAMMNASKRTGGTLAIELFSAPWWMMGKARDGNFANLASFTVLDANVGVWGDFCAYVANRYWPDVQNFVWWSETKGYFDNALNRWQYERITANYNQVWAKVKAAQPTAKIGGPFITTRSALEHRTGIPTFASDGSSIVSNLQVLGETWHVDAKQLDTAIYWLANATGYDFVCNDGAIWPNNDPTAVDPFNDKMQPTTPWPVGTLNTVQHTLGAVVFDDREKPRLVAEWWAAHTPAGTPHWWTESYPGSGVDPVPDFQADYDSKKAGGVRVMFMWLGKNAPRVGTRLWTPGTDTRTAVGDTAAAITTANG